MVKNVILKDIIYRGDYLDIMGQLPDDSIDLIVADPPYFRPVKDWWDNQWANFDNDPSWMMEIATCWDRLLSPTGYNYLLCEIDSQWGFVYYIIFIFVKQSPYTIEM